MTFIRHSSTTMAITLEGIKSCEINRFIDCFESLIEEGKEILHCKVKDCNRIYYDKSGAIRHIRVNHCEIHEVIREKNIPKIETNSWIDSIELRVKVKVEDIWNAVIDLVTVNGLPLCVVEYPAFKKILEPYVIALKRQNIELAINRQNIRTRIDAKAKDIKKLIMSQVRNRIVALMADIASRYNRSVLGVNIIYVINGKYCLRTIGMHILRFSHTANNIVNMIKKNLSDFHIRLEQVISATTDNGKNMIKSIAMLDSSYQNEKGSQANGLESDEEEQIDSTIFNDDYYEDVLERVTAEFSEFCHTDLIHGISCAAHCIHLVVTHAIDKSTETKQLIEKCRQFAKKLRTPTMRSMLHTAGYNMALIDVITRWNSIYTMVKIFKFLPFSFPSNLFLFCYS